MTYIAALWRDERSWIDRSRAIRTLLFALALTAAGAFYLDARNDLYEQMSKRQAFAAATSMTSDEVRRHV